MAAGGPIYLDCNATTPVDPRVLEAMLPHLGSGFGNAASGHAVGRAARAAVERARGQVAALVGAQPAEIIFTSGATEADNLAIKGAARALAGRGRHLLVSAVEHPAVLDSARSLAGAGFELDLLRVDPVGRVLPETLRAALRPDTILCSVMLANNEVGTVQPVAELGGICREAGVVFHCDAAQGLGCLPFDLSRLPVDLASFSAHKLYGPQGVGALYVRRSRPRLRLQPLLHGGGHERGLRSGTLPLHQVVGFGRAAELALSELRDPQVISGLRGLRDELLAGLQSRLDHLQVHGCQQERLPGNLNLSFACVEAEALLAALPDLALSTGAACSSASLSPSHVLRAMGVSEDDAHSSVRFGLGRFTTREELQRAVELVSAQVRRLRAASPVYALLDD